MTQDACDNALHLPGVVLFLFYACVTLLVFSDDVLHLPRCSGGQDLHQHLLSRSCPLQAKEGNVSFQLLSLLKFQPVHEDQCVRLVNSFISVTAAPTLIAW